MNELKKILHIPLDAKSELATIKLPHTIEYTERHATAHHHDGSITFDSLNELREAYKIKAEDFAKWHHEQNAAREHVEIPVDALPVTPPELAVETSEAPAEVPVVKAETK